MTPSCNADLTDDNSLYDLEKLKISQSDGLECHLLKNKLLATPRQEMNRLQLSFSKTHVV